MVLLQGELEMGYTFAGVELVSTVALWLVDPGGTGVEAFSIRVMIRWTAYIDALVLPLYYLKPMWLSPESDSHHPFL